MNIFFKQNIFNNPKSRAQKLEAFGLDRSSLTFMLDYRTSEAVAQRGSVKKSVLKILKIHRKTPVPESLF